MMLRIISEEPNDTKYHFSVEVLPYGEFDRFYASAMSADGAACINSPRQLPELWVGVSTAGDGFDGF